MDERHHTILATAATLNSLGLPSGAREIGALLPFLGDLLGTAYPFEEASRAHGAPPAVRCCLADLGGHVQQAGGSWQVADPTVIDRETLERVAPLVERLAGLLPLRSPERLARFSLVAERMRRCAARHGSYGWSALRRSIETDRQLYEESRDPSWRPVYQAIADVLSRRHTFTGYCPRRSAR